MTQQSYPAAHAASATPLVVPVAFYPTATNALSISALIVSCFAWVLPFVGGIVAVILGHVGLSQVVQRGEGGRNLAITALVLGYASMVFWVAFVIIVTTTDTIPLEIPGIDVMNAAGR